MTAAITKASIKVAVKNISILEDHNVKLNYYVLTFEYIFSGNFRKTWS